jgi:hypothetical protein
MPSVAWRDEDEEAAVRDEVDGVLGRLTRDWAVSRDDARGAGPTGRTDDASAIDLDAVFGDEETRTKQKGARFLHRSAEDEEVRAVLESMRRATLGLTERDLRAMRARRERNDDGTFDRVHLDRDAPEPYVMDGVLPPWYAKTCYKTVAVVAPDDGIDHLGDSLEEKKKARLVRLRVRRLHQVRAGHDDMPPVAAGPRRRFVRLANHRGVLTARPRPLPGTQRVVTRAARHREGALLEPGPSGRTRVLRQ